MFMSSNREFSLLFTMAYAMARPFHVFHTVLETRLLGNYHVRWQGRTERVGSGGCDKFKFIKFSVNLYKIDIGRFLKTKRSVNLEFMVVTSYLTICCLVIFICIKLY